MFDTRSGFWLMIGIAASALIATGAVIAFAPDDQITYDNFGAAVGVPMVFLLPVMAILSVTSEWSQRSGLTTFTLVPNRSRVLAAKAIVGIAIGAVSIGVALAIGALGNLVGAGIAGVDPVWDISLSQALTLTFANVMNLMIGFMLGVLIRNSPGAVVGYFVYGFVLPPLTMLLAQLNGWWEDKQPWLDFNFAQGPLYEGQMSGTEWAHLATSGVDLAGDPAGRRPGARAPVRGQVATRPSRPSGRLHVAFATAEPAASAYRREVLPRLSVLVPALALSGRAPRGACRPTPTWSAPRARGTSSSRTSACGTPSTTRSSSAPARCCGRPRSRCSARLAHTSEGVDLSSSRVADERDGHVRHLRLLHPRHLHRAHHRQLPDRARGQHPDQRRRQHLPGPPHRDPHDAGGQAPAGEPVPPGRQRSRTSGRAASSRPAAPRCSSSARWTAPGARSGVRRTSPTRASPRPS